MKAKIIIGDITKAKIIQDGNGNIIFIKDVDGKHWYDEAGEYHREDGPAVEYPDGSKRWWYHGKEMDCSSQKEFERIIKLKAFW